MVVEYGVPQGSVLGPVLFILYINDIVEVKTKESTIQLFADDTMIFVAGNSVEELEIKLNTTLQSLEKWLRLNKLKMNANKTQYMIVRSIRKELSREIVVTTGKGIELKRVTKMKYLGLMLDDRLQFKEHCDYIIKKVGKKTCFLQRIGNHISAYARSIVYKSIIAPHFEYYSTVMLCMGITEIDKLQKAQNRAMRAILHVDRSASISSMLEALQFMSIKERMEYNACVFVFKILKEMLPIDLVRRVQLVAERRERETRQDANVVINIRKTTSAQKSVLYAGVKIYNELPNIIKNSVSIHSFKQDMKEYIKSKREQGNR